MMWSGVPTNWEKKMGTPKDILDERFARGEIQIEEYRAMVAAMSGQTTASKPAEGFFSKVFGPNSVEMPTDASPLQINDTFSMFGSYFSYGRKTYRYQDIISLHFFASKSAMSGVNLDSATQLIITMFSGEKIDLKGFSILIAGKTNKLISIAHKLLAQVSFDQRLNRVVNIIRSEGSYSVDGAKIYPNGNIVKGSTRINLKTAAMRKHLALGHSFYLTSVQGYSEPYEVVAGEDGTSIFSKRVCFKVHDDTDVIFHILKVLAGVADSELIFSRPETKRNTQPVSRTVLAAHVESQSKESSSGKCPLCGGAVTNKVCQSCGATL
jgi:hypothetical protein